MRPAHLRSHSKRQLIDCGACPASRGCWDEPVASTSGFLVRRHAEIANGTRLFCQGGRFAGVYIVVAGCVKLLEVSADGTDRIVALCLPGELIGMEGWTRGHYPYAAIAAGSASVCQLHWPQSKHGTQSPALLERLLHKTAAQLGYSTRVWLSLPAVDRVAAFLTRFAERTGSALELPLTRSEIGSLLGLAEETVVRAIRTLQLHRQLRFEGKRVICLANTKTASGNSASAVTAGA